MRIGGLRERFVLKTPLLVADGMGGYASTWAVAGGVWGQITPLSSLPSVNAAPRITHIIRIRRAVDVSVETGMRLENDGVFYAVHALVNVKNSKGLVDLHVEEGGDL